MPKQPPKPEIRVYEGIEFEIIPISNFTSSDLIVTVSQVIDRTLTPYDEEHDERVAQAKKARSFVKRLGGRDPVQ